MRVALCLMVVAALLGGRSASGSPSAPNDPAWPGEWGPVLTRTTGVWQAVTTGSPRVVVAVVDTGVEPIPDLAGALVPGIDLLGGSDSPSGASAAHGTWVASVIAARGDNARDAAGYCWGCSIMPVRISDGSAPASGATIARGIRWAVDHGAQIVNVSLAGPEPSPDEEAAVAYAAAHHVIVVSAAGNGGDASPWYPAAYPSVLSVAATDEHDRLYSWSTRGPWVALAAPGCTTVVDPDVGAADACGSSFAPAAVAGIAGLLLSADPALTTDQVVAALRSTAVPVDGVGGGRVDAFAALAALRLPEAAQAPEREITVLTGRLSARRAFTIRTGPGRLAVLLVTQAAASCQMQLRFGRDVVDSFAAGGPVLSLEGVASAGSHRLTVTCSTRKAVPFTLQIERTPAR